MSDPCANFNYKQLRRLMLDNIPIENRRNITRRDEMCDVLRKFHILAEHVGVISLNKSSDGRSPSPVRRVSPSRQSPRQSPRQKSLQFTDLPPEILSNILSKNMYNKASARVNKMWNVETNYLYDPSVNNNLAIREASKKGNFDLVKHLLRDPRVDPTANDNEAFRSAVTGNFVDIVKLLLKDPRVDPTANDNEAFFFTIHKKNASDPEITTLLFNDKRVVDPEIRKLPSSHHNQTINWDRRRISKTATQLVSRDMSRRYWGDYSSNE